MDTFKQGEGILMEALLVIIHIFLILAALCLIVAVLMQEGNSQGLGAIGGAAETFLGKNKSRSLEGKLELITKISAGAFVVLALLMVLVQNIVG